MLRSSFSNVSPRASLSTVATILHRTMSNGTKNQVEENGVSQSPDVTFDHSRFQEQLFAQNRIWAQSIKKINPNYFEQLSKQQHPKYLWIGCSDSRVPANVLMNLAPGEVFVHRNIANVVVHSDLNCLSVIQFAVEVLKVEHIIVCGHYGCGGVKAACGHAKYGLIDNWLRHIKDVYIKNESEVSKISNEDKLVEKMCELNVLQSVNNVVATTIVQGAWERNQPLSVHGWIYSISDGLLREISEVKNLHTLKQIKPIYQMASPPS